MRSITATFLTWVMFASAQQPVPQAGRPQQAPATATTTPKTSVTFSTSLQMVVEDIVLKDKSGNAITGLKPSDFTVTEDGKPQKVEFVEFQNLEETATPIADTPEPAKQLEKRPEPAQPQPKAATANQIAPGKPGDIKYRDRRLLVMFFDMTSMPLADQVRAQTAATKFVKTQMTKSDLMAVMKFSSDIKVVEDFTDDRDALLKDIKNLTIGEGQGFDVTADDDSTADTAAAFNQDDSEFNIFNTDRQLSALETAAKMLSSLNEKKALVYFASGMTKTGTDNQAQLQATVNAAIRSNVSFFPIDTRGLQASAPLGEATQASSGGSAM